MAAILYLHADHAPIRAALDSLLEHLPKIPLEFHERVLGRFDALAQAGCIDVETLRATAAGEVRIALKPTKALADLVLAVRTGNVHLV